MPTSKPITISADLWRLRANRDHARPGITASNTQPAGEPRDRSIVVASAPNAMWSETLTHLVATAHTASIIRTPTAPRMRKDPGRNTSTAPSRIAKAAIPTTKSSGLSARLDASTLVQEPLRTCRTISAATGKSAIRVTRSRVLRASRGVLKCSATPRTMTIVMAKGWPTIDIHRATTFISGVRCQSWPRQELWRRRLLLVPVPVGLRRQ